MVEDGTLVALYTTTEAAERTRRRLIELGVPGGQVSLVGEERAGSTADYVQSENDGFFRALKDFFLPERDLYTYREGIRRGAKMVTAHVPAQMMDGVRAAMEEADPLDIDASLSEWRSAGWSDFGTVKGNEADERRRRAEHSSRVHHFRN